LCVLAIRLNGTKVKEEVCMMASSHYHYQNALLILLFRFLFVRITRQKPYVTYGFILMRSALWDLYAIKQRAGRDVNAAEGYWY
jgi:hypothetical protein